MSDSLPLEAVQCVLFDQSTYGVAMPEGERGNMGLHKSVHLYWGTTVTSSKFSGVRHLYAQFVQIKVLCLPIGTARLVYTLGSFQEQNCWGIMHVKRI